MVILVFAILVVFVPVTAYVCHGGAKNSAWGLVSAGDGVRGAGVYRGLRTTLWKPGSAPVVVRVAAISSFFLGQMIVPGAFAALLGILVMAIELSEGKAPPVQVVLTLSIPTGLGVAARLLSAGSEMLSRADSAVPTARRAARWALWHNLLLLAGLGLAVMSAPDEAPFAAASAIYAAVSIGQALLVRRAASAMEGYAARQLEAGAPAAST